MFFVYVLLLSNNTHYTGQTNNLVRRLIEHNSGRSISTRRFLPVRCIFSREVPTRKAARKLEVHIKKMGAKRFLSHKKFHPNEV